MKPHFLLALVALALATPALAQPPAAPQAKAAAGWRAAAES